MSQSSVHAVHPSAFSIAFSYPHALNSSIDSVRDALIIRCLALALFHLSVIWYGGLNTSAAVGRPKNDNNLLFQEDRAHQSRRVSHAKLSHASFMKRHRDFLYFYVNKLWFPLWYKGIETGVSSKTYFRLHIFAAEFHVFLLYYYAVTFWLIQSLHWWPSMMFRVNALDTFREELTLTADVYRRVSDLKVKHWNGSKSWD